MVMYETSRELGHCLLDEGLELAHVDRGKVALIDPHDYGALANDQEVFVGRRALDGEVHCECLARVPVVREAHLSNGAGKLLASGRSAQMLAGGEIGIDLLVAGRRVSEGSEPFDDRREATTGLEGDGRLRCLLDALRFEDVSQA